MRDALHYFEGHEWEDLREHQAFDLDRPGLQFAAKAQGAVNPVASGKLAGAPLGYGTAAEQLVALASGAEPFGIAKCASFADGERMTSYEAGNYKKAVAGASLGAWTNLGIASTNGALGPLLPASGAVGWSIGKSVGAAIAGDVFTVLIRPLKVSNP